MEEEYQIRGVVKVPRRSSKGCRISLQVIKKGA